MTDVDTFLERVEKFLAQHEMTPTFFGKSFAGDPLFVFQLREGREPRRATRDRITAAMREYRAPVTGDAA